MARASRRLALKRSLSEESAGSWNEQSADATPKECKKTCDLCHKKRTRYIPTADPPAVATPLFPGSLRRSFKQLHPCPISSSPLRLPVVPQADAETVLVFKVTNKQYQLLTLIIRPKGLNAAAKLLDMLRPAFCPKGFATQPQPNQRHIRVLF